MARPMSRFWRNHLGTPGVRDPGRVAGGQFVEDDRLMVGVESGVGCRGRQSRTRHDYLKQDGLDEGRLSFHWK